MIDEKLEKRAEELFRYGNILNDFNYEDGEELPHRLTTIYYQQGVHIVHKCCGNCLAIFEV